LPVLSRVLCWLAAALLAVAAGSAPVLAKPPVLEKAKGEKCVEETSVMRKRHPDFLKHQRDDTVHGGIRGAKHSLAGCVECHASAKDGSVLGSPQHFCQGCHEYTAVKLDCFECHASHTKAAQAAHRKGGR
jgi:hypothetical protein